MPNKAVNRKSREISELKKNVNFTRENLVYTLIYFAVPAIPCAIYSFKNGFNLKSLLAFFVLLMFVLWFYCLFTVVFVEAGRDKGYKSYFGEHIAGVIVYIAVYLFLIPILIIALPLLYPYLPLIIVFLIFSFIMLFLGGSFSVSDSSRQGYVDYSCFYTKEMKKALRTNDLDRAKKLFLKTGRMLSIKNLYLMFLIRAVENRNMEAVENYVEMGANISNIRNASMVFNQAVISGALDIALYLINKGIYFAPGDETVTMLFNKAVRKEDLTLMEAMINKGYNVNRSNEFGRTALHYAFLRRKNRSIKFLLEKRAKCSIKDYKGKTPIDYASERRKEEFTAFMKEKRLG